MNEKESYGVLADEKSIHSTIEALNGNGFNALLVQSADEAKKMVLQMLPENAEIMTMTSVTLDHTGIAREINESGKYASVREKLTLMKKETQGSEMQKLGAAPDWVVGSVHAVTEDGKVLIASATGSQLPAYVYGSNHVVWVVGAQKIVSDLEDGFRRILEYVFPLENERAMKSYGMGSGINKLLMINKEVSPGRITMIIVKEKLGF